MKSKIVALFAAPFLLLATAAVAADLPRRSPPPPVEYYAPPPAFTWQGLYLGIHAGYGFSSFKDGGRDLFGSPSGGLIGATGGYNFMVAPNFLLGVEADFAFTGIGRDRSPSFWVQTHSAVDDALTVRGRAGYAMERALLYVTGGFAGANTSLRVNNILGNFWGSQSTFQSGWALGGGLEYMLTNHLSAKAEYMFTSVGTDQFFNFSPNALQTGVNTSSVKGGLNYHF